MQDAQTLLYNRYSVLHIERNNNFNKVLFALDTYQSPSRSCVIKVFEPISEKFDIIQWIDREFSIEANRLKQLSLRNSHLPQIYTYSNDARNYYTVRELIEGRTLEETIQDTGRFSAKEVRDILIELLPVLEYIHSNKIIHQNIKPKNIILRNGDRFPMLINFGSIKQIVATYGFYGDKQIFSTNNIYGYAPFELALGRPVPASDLYSLGLTAIYLLTAKHPVDLGTSFSLNNFKMPSIIASLDRDLARVINRAIKPNINDRYSSAQEMLDDLLQNDFYNGYHKPTEDRANSITTVSSNSIIQTPSNKVILKEDASHNAITFLRDKGLNWWKIILSSIGSLYILGNAIIFWYDWNLSQNTVVPELSEPSTSLSPVETKLPQEQIDNKASMLNSQSRDLVEIPILPTGTSKQELIDTLGQPNAVQKGYWSNSSALIYKNRANGSIDMGYLFDVNTDKLRQTEVAIAPSVGLGTIQNILNSLLQGNVDLSTNQALKNIYQRQADEYSFEVKNLKGSIEREDDDHIYLGVWESDFH